MSDRYFTAAELTALSRSPRQEIEDRLADDPGTGGQLVASIARAYMDQIGGSRAWIGSVFAYLSERGGDDRWKDAVGTTARMFQALAASGVGLGRTPLAEDVATDPNALVERFAERASCGDLAGALAAYDTYEDACRLVQDVYRDWLSALLSAVYRWGGPDELESLHRFCAERTLLPWMEVDIRNHPAKRLTRWVRMLKGHFSRVEVMEDDEKFILVQDPCGTCSLQILAGRYQPPADLAIVEEEHTVTWGRGTTPVYRTHVPVWHIAMAKERLGVPWPVNQCPAGLGAGPCATLLFKDPLSSRANDFVPGPTHDYDNSASP